MAAKSTHKDTKVKVGKRDEKRLKLLGAKIRRFQNQIMGHKETKRNTKMILDDNWGSGDKWKKSAKQTRQAVKSRSLPTKLETKNVKQFESRIYER